MGTVEFRSRYAGYTVRQHRFTAGSLVVSDAVAAELRTLPECGEGKDFWEVVPEENKGAGDQGIKAEAERQAEKPAGGADEKAEKPADDKPADEKNAKPAKAGAKNK